MASLLKSTWVMIVVLLIFVIRTGDTWDDMNGISAPQLRNLAESTFGILARYCDVKTLRCDNLPRNVSYVDIFPVHFQNSSETTNITNLTEKFHTSDFPADWLSYIYPGVFEQNIDPLKIKTAMWLKHSPKGTLWSQVPYCEGDLMNINCSSNSQHDQLEVNKKIQWPDATVPFIIDEMITDENLRDVILEAMILLSNGSCINFVEANLVVHTNYVVFVKAHQYAADVGSGPRQIVKVLDTPVTNNTLGEVLHLLMHVLGFGHEHSRPDRDAFVWINYANVEPEHLADLSNSTQGRYASVSTPYDYGSVTHYDYFKFAKRWYRPTILPKVTGFRIGQHDRLSPTDFYKINTLYGCSANAINDKPTLKKRHIGVEKDLIIEDSVIRYGTSVPPQFKTLATSTPNPGLICPVCACTCPSTMVPDTTTTVSSSPAPLTSFLQPPTPAGENLEPFPASSVVNLSTPFNPSIWHKMKGQNPLDSYVKDVLQSALQNSALGFLLNKNGDGMANAPGNGVSPATLGQEDYASRIISPYANFNYPTPSQPQQFSGYQAPVPYAQYQGK